MKLKRILFVHNQYQVRGGEDVALEADVSLLKEKGHEVRVFLLHNDSIKGKFGAVLAAFRSIFSFRSYSAIRNEIKSFRPDVIHVHNFFPLISPSVFWAAKRGRVPIVMSVHNYRLICVNGLLLRDGKICEACVGKVPWRGAVFACYRNSRMASLSLAIMLTIHRILGTWSKKIDLYLCFTKFNQNKLVKLGVPLNKTRLIRGYFDSPETKKVDPSQRKFALYLGRLSEEKGILSLLDHWVAFPYPLKIVGKGPQLEQVRKKIRNYPHITLDPEASRDQALNYLSEARVLIVPSRCYEGGIPMVLKEATSKSLPMIVSRLGGLPEVIVDGQNGFTFDVGVSDQLRSYLDTIFRSDSAWSELSKQSFETYWKMFSRESYYEELQDIYSEAGESV